MTSRKLLMATLSLLFLANLPSSYAQNRFDPVVVDPFAHLKELSPNNDKIRPIIQNASLRSCIGDAAPECRRIQALSSRPTEAQEGYFQYQKALLSFTSIETAEVHENGGTSWSLSVGDQVIGMATAFIPPDRVPSIDGSFKINGSYEPVRFVPKTAVVVIPANLDGARLTLKAFVTNATPDIPYIESGSVLGARKGTSFKDPNIGVSGKRPNDEPKKSNISPFGSTEQSIRFRLPSPVVHIVSLGDSFAAGQGAPDIDGERSYSDQQCERSANAAITQAVDNLTTEERNNHVVQYTNFACTGATINVGVLGPYTGPGLFSEISSDTIFRNPTVLSPVGSMPNQALPSQVDQVQAHIEANNLPGIDIVSLTVGGNDSGFLNIILGCSLTEPTNNIDWEIVTDVANELNTIAGLTIANNCHESFTQRQTFGGNPNDMTREPGAHKLSENYLRVARAISSFDAAHVIATGYPSVTKYMDINNRPENCERVNDTYYVTVLPHNDHAVVLIGFESGDADVFPPNIIAHKIASISINKVVAEEWSMIDNLILDAINGGIATAVNQINRANLDRSQWEYVSVYEATEGFGLCAGLIPERRSNQRGGASMFNTLSVAMNEINSIWAAVHPNERGYSAMSDPLHERLVLALD